MNRRAFLLTLGSAAVATAAADPKRPNIILAMADDQGWGDTSYNGHPVLKTPTLDAMSRSGIRFDRFYSGAPVCSPTRGSCLTGRHPYRYGIFFANADTGADDPSKYILPDRERTIAEYLKPLGYTAGHFGKWHLGDFSGPRKSAPTDNGFDEFFSTTRKVATLDPDGYWTKDGRIPAASTTGDDSELLMSRALDFIRRAARRGQPFVAVIWFHAPHVPFRAGQKHRAPYASEPESTQHYWGSIASVDEQMGRLRSTLDELGIRQDTMLWYASDNGPEGDRGEDASPGTAGPWRGRKRSLFEGGVRVPGLLEWPRRFPKPFVVKAAASTSDYLPTVLSALNQPIAPAADFDGINLLPLLQSRKPSRERAIGFETMGNTRGSPKLALIEDRFKLLSNLEESGDLLFDLSADPGETTDVAAKYPDVRSRMKEALKRWRESCTRSREGLPEH